MGTSTRPARVTDMESEASVSILSESNSEQASDLLPGSKGKNFAQPRPLSVKNCVLFGKFADSATLFTLRCEADCISGVARGGAHGARAPH